LRHGSTTGCREASGEQGTSKASSDHETKGAHGLTLIAAAHQLIKAWLMDD
jgi:hypothetical protein